jgi:hypothetical protein
MIDVNKISVSDSNYEQRVEGWLEKDLSDVKDSDTDPNYAIQSDHYPESEQQFSSDKEEEGLASDESEPDQEIASNDETSTLQSKKKSHFIWMK